MHFLRELHLQLAAPGVFFFCVFFIFFASTLIWKLKRSRLGDVLPEKKKKKRLGVD